MDEPGFPLPNVAAVVFENGDDADAAMAEAVATLQGSGLRVAGLLQRLGPALGDCRREMHLLVLSSGEWIRLDQKLGAFSEGCALDGDALAQAGQALRAAIAAGPDLLVVSRFGKQEAQGTGIRDDIAEAVLSGIPVIVGVRDHMRAEWESFLGGTAEVLPPDAAAIAAWARAHAAAVA